MPMIYLEKLDMFFQLGNHNSFDITFLSCMFRKGQGLLNCIQNKLQPGYKVDFNELFYKYFDLYTKNRSFI